MVGGLFCMPQNNQKNEILREKPHILSLVHGRPIAKYIF